VRPAGCGRAPGQRSPHRSGSRCLAGASGPRIAAKSILGPQHGLKPMTVQRPHGRLSAATTQDSTARCCQVAKLGCWCEPLQCHAMRPNMGLWSFTGRLRGRQRAVAASGAGRCGRSHDGRCDDLLWPGTQPGAGHSAGHQGCGSELTQKQRPARVASLLVLRVCLIQVSATVNAVYILLQYVVSEPCTARFSHACKPRNVADRQTRHTYAHWFCSQYVAAIGWLRR